MTFIRILFILLVSNSCYALGIMNNYVVIDFGTESDGNPKITGYVLPTDTVFTAELLTSNRVESMPVITLGYKPEIGSSDSEVVSEGKSFNIRTNITNRQPGGIGMRIRNAMTSQQFQLTVDNNSILSGAQHGLMIDNISAMYMDIRVDTGSTITAYDRLSDKNSFESALFLNSYMDGDIEIQKNASIVGPTGILFGTSGDMHGNVNINGWLIGTGELDSDSAIDMSEGITLPFDINIFDTGRVKGDILGKENYQGRSFVRLLGGSMYGDIVDMTDVEFQEVGEIPTFIGNIYNTNNTDRTNIYVDNVIVGNKGGNTFEWEGNLIFNDKSSISFAVDETNSEQYIQDFIGGVIDGSDLNVWFSGETKISTKISEQLMKSIFYKNEGVVNSFKLIDVESDDDSGIKFKTSESQEWKDFSTANAAEKDEYINRLQFVHELFSGDISIYDNGISVINLSALSKSEYSNINPLWESMVNGEIGSFNDTVEYDITSDPGSPFYLGANDFPFVVDDEYDDDKFDEDEEMQYERVANALGDDIISETSYENTESLSTEDMFGTLADVAYNNRYDLELTDIAEDVVNNNSDEENNNSELDEKVESLFRIFSGINSPETIAALDAENKTVIAEGHSRAMVAEFSEGLSSHIISEFSVGKSEVVSTGDELSDTNVWAKAIYSEGVKNGEYNSRGVYDTGSKTRTNGILLGADVTGTNWVLGGSIGKGISTFNAVGKRDWQEVEYYQLAFYGQWNTDNLFINSIVYGGTGEVKRGRYLDGFSDASMLAKYKIYSAGLDVIAGKKYKIKSMPFTITPIIGTRYAFMHHASFAEKDYGNVGFSQEVDSHNQQSVDFGLGLYMSKMIKLGNGYLTPELGVMGWSEVFSKKEKYNARYSIAPDSDFTVESSEAEKTSIMSEIKLNYTLPEVFNISLGYIRKQKSGFYSDTYSVRMDYIF